MFVIDLILFSNFFYFSLILLFEMRTKFSRLKAVSNNY